MKLSHIFGVKANTILDYTNKKSVDYATCNKHVHQQERKIKSVSRKQYDFSFTNL